MLRNFCFTIASLLLAFNLNAQIIFTDQYAGYVGFDDMKTLDTITVTINQINNNTYLNIQTRYLDLHLKTSIYTDSLEFNKYVGIPVIHFKMLEKIENVIHYADFQLYENKFNGLFLVKDPSINKSTSLMIAAFKL